MSRIRLLNKLVTINYIAYQHIQLASTYYTEKLRALTHGNNRFNKRHTAMPEGVVGGRRPIKSRSVKNREKKAKALRMEQVDFCFEKNS
jgi:hypothetical protein